jgi:conjugative transfer signal peptidase TraF
LRLDDLVIVEPPEPLARFLSDRGYLPRGLPLVKRVLALPGQTVCRRDLLVTIDGIAIAPARERDRAGRPLPVWQGCRTIPPNEVFLMNRDVPDSIDGRYFGPLPASSILGRAVPLLTFEEQ